jgi:Arylsulfotransferase (ASST)
MDSYRTAVRNGRAGVLLALALALLSIASVSQAAAHPARSGGRLTISPTPGTPDVEPHAQISLLNVAPNRIESVLATGSVSGVHPGRLRAYSSGRGASFLPAQPFAQGERVSVEVGLRGRGPVHFSFDVAHLGPIPPVLNLPQQQPAKLNHYTSRPDLLPPLLTVNKGGSSPGGDIFLTPLPSPIVHPESNNAITINPVGPGGPMIADPQGNLVWFKQLAPPDVAANLRIQRYRGQRVLTWWQGSVTLSAFGQGEGVIADSSYRTLATVQAGNGYSMDIHEFELTPTGDALFTIYSPVLVHLPGTPAGTLSRLLDAIVQEVDVRTGLVVWEWHSYGHIPLEDSYATPANSASYDAFHLNSIQALQRGRVLVSARDTSAVYEIDRASGKILWTLGGKASDFELGPGARFFFQHDAQMLPNGNVSLFDDEAGPPMMAPSSRGLVLALDRRRRSASVVAEYHRSNDTSAQSEGSLQTLPGGNAFVGFGSTPFFSEFSPGGSLLYDASLPQDDGSYRVYRFPWRASPTTRPDLAAHRTGPSSVSVYASWNGATDVARWQVLAGQSATSLRAVSSAPKQGFETRIDLTSSSSTFEVRALSQSGRVLATSAALPAS